MTFREEPLLLRDALVEARLSGRHGWNQAECLEYLIEARGVPGEAEGVRKQLIEAFAEGVAARKAGYPCSCRGCMSLTPSMREKEDARRLYTDRRRAELQAGGMSFDEASRVVEREIDAGAALQATPTVVRRVKGDAG